MTWFMKSPLLAVITSERITQKVNPTHLILVTELRENREKIHISMSAVTEQNSTKNGNIMK